MRERLEERVAVPGCTSRRLCAVESGMLLAQMPEESMEMGKRAPSSFEDGLACVVVVSGECSLLCPVDDAYWIFCLYPVVGERLQHLNSCYDAEYAIVYSAGGLGVEVRAGKCEWASLRRHSRTAKILPTASIVVWQPSVWVASTNQPRACLSASERARQHMPVSVGTLYEGSSMLAMSFFSGIYSRTLRLFGYIIRSRED